jgi:PAS domain S-box-containing protein
MLQTLKDAQEILDALPVGVFWKDKNSVLGCNHYVAIHAGIKSTAEIVGKIDQDLSWAHYADKYRADDQDTMQSGYRKLNYFEEISDRKGSRMWIRTTKLPLVVNGEICGVVGIYQDITEITTFLDDIFSVLTETSRKSQELHSKLAAAETDPIIEILPRLKTAIAASVIKEVLPKIKQTIIKSVDVVPEIKTVIAQSIIEEIVPEIKAVIEKLDLKALAV